MLCFESIVGKSQYSRLQTNLATLTLIQCKDKNITQATVFATVFKMKNVFQLFQSRSQIVSSACVTSSPLNSSEAQILLTMSEAQIPLTIAA